MFFLQATIEFHGFSMVLTLLDHRHHHHHHWFQKFLKFWGQWSTLFWRLTMGLMYHCTKKIVANQEFTAVQINICRTHICWNLTFTVHNREMPLNIDFSMNANKCAHSFHLHFALFNLRFRLRFKKRFRRKEWSTERTHKEEEGALSNEYHGWLQKSIIKIQNGNCNHRKVPFLIETIVNLNDLTRPLMVFRRPLKMSMVLKRLLEIFNGF